MQNLEYQDFLAGMNKYERVVWEIVGGFLPHESIPYVRWFIGDQSPSLHHLDSRSAAQQRVNSAGGSFDKMGTVATAAAGRSVYR
jgi:hypothetical protein